jgi:hypothetical protein
MDDLVECCWYLYLLAGDRHTALRRIPHTPSVIKRPIEARRQNTRTLDARTGCGMLLAEGCRR